MSVAQDAPEKAGPKTMRFYGGHTLEAPKDVLTVICSGVLPMSLPALWTHFAFTLALIPFLVFKAACISHPSFLLIVHCPAC